MKLSYLVASSNDISSESVLAYRGKLELILPALRKLGYDGIELAVRNPRNINQKQLLELCAESELEMTGICTGEVYGEDGLYFLGPDRRVARKAIERMKKIIDFASPFSCSINIGRLRGNLPEKNRTESLDEVCSIFSDLASYAERYGVCLLLEPINRFQCNFVHTTPEGIEIVNKVNSKHFQLMIDIFHMNIEDTSLESSIMKAKECLRHFHICDSNRYSPGKGHLDFKAIIDALRGISYAGFLSGEIVPLSDHHTAAKDTVEFLKPLL